MRALIPIAALSVGAVAALSARADTSAPQPTTIAGCAALLPAGATYSFEIIGRIDTTGDSPTLSGEMSVSDGTHVDRSAESVAFQQCVVGLLK